MPFKRSLFLLYAVTLFACGRPGNNAELKALHENSASRLHEKLTEKLRQEFGEDEGRVWTSTRLDLSGDWLLQSPEGYWGKAPQEIPSTVNCSLNESNCDPVFKRIRCESDADCSTLGTSCQPLEAAVSKLGADVPQFCLAGTDVVLNRIYRTMTAAEKELDIVSLSLPTGQFRESMINALSVLSQKPNPPKVRFLFSGGPGPAIPDALSSASKALDKIAEEVLAKSPRASQLKMNLAFLNSPTRLSWNHSKIIVADGERALSGGHNLWEDVYLTPQPLFDLSMEYRGEAATASRDFVNTLWSLPHAGEAFFPKDAERFAPFSESYQTGGKVAAITVGRLGHFGSNPSDRALETMIHLAQESVRIDQQDLYNHVVSRITRTFIEDELVQAALRGVQIQIVQSNNFPFVGGFGSVDGDKVYKVLVKRVADELRRHQFFSKDAARAFACSAIEYAPFRFSASISKWDSSWKTNTLGTHSKLVIVDDRAFYIGSHNLYPANLVEFGVIVSDEQAATELKNTYWDKVWAESQSAKYPCPRFL